MQIQKQKSVSCRYLNIVMIRFEFLGYMNSNNRKILQ